MTVDPIGLSGAVVRRVEPREHEGRQATAVMATRSYPTSIDDLWDALTNAERIPRWFLPISGDLRVGGRYALEGNAEGTITRCERPDLLALTWEAMGDVTWVTVRLRTESPASTELELEHVARVAPELWEQFGPGAVGVGWDLGLLGLGLHIDGGRVLEGGDAWATSEPGRAFVGASSDAWANASIAAGTPEAQARAASERTTAFYTGS